MLRFLASLFLALALSWPAFAQPTPNIHIASKGPWSVDCSAEPQTGEKWCEVSTAFKGDKPPYSAEFHYVRDSRMFFVRGSIPMSGARVQVDSHAAYVLDRCLAGMCLLKGASAERLLAELRSGTRLLVQFQTRPQIPGPLAVELADFDAMYRATLAAPK